MKIDWKLKGFNLLKFVCNKSSVLHPETCSNQVLIDHDSEITLRNWLTRNGDFTVEDSLDAWITNNFMRVVGSDTQFIINADYEANTFSDLGDLTDYNSLLIGTLNQTSEVRVPYGTTTRFGTYKVGSGLTSSTGVLSLSAATANTYGGIKTGFTRDGNNIPVQLNNIGQAYVSLNDVVNEITIPYWNKDVPEHTPSNVVPSIFHVLDTFDTVNLNNYIYEINNIFSRALDPQRLYPIRADIYGHLYTFVPWTDTTYSVYNNTAAVGNGLVPYSSNNTNNTTAFLCKDGSWKVPSYTNLNNTPSAFNGSANGLVPANGAANNKFLRGDGTWQIPVNTTYNTALPTNPEGLLMVMDSIATTTTDLADNAGSTTTFRDLFIPITYNEDYKTHGVSLKLILDAIIADTDPDGMLVALKNALNSI